MHQTGTGRLQPKIKNDNNNINGNTDQQLVPPSQRLLDALHACAFISRTNFLSRSHDYAYDHDHGYPALGTRT